MPSLTVPYSGGSTYYWTVPAGVTSVTCEALSSAGNSIQIISSTIDGSISISQAANVVINDVLVGQNVLITNSIGDIALGHTASPGSTFNGTLRITDNYGPISINNTVVVGATTISENSNTLASDSILINGGQFDAPLTIENNTYSGGEITVGGPVILMGRGVYTGNVPVATVTPESPIPVGVPSSPLSETTCVAGSTAYSSGTSPTSISLSGVPLCIYDYTVEGDLNFTGGLGNTAQATFPVTPGQVLAIGVSLTGAQGSTVTGPAGLMLRAAGVGGMNYISSTGTSSESSIGTHSGIGSVVLTWALNPPTVSLVSPANGYSTNLYAGATIFSWAYAPGIAGNSQTAWAFKRELTGGSGVWVWWSVVGQSWVDVETFNLGSIQSYTFPPGTWLNGFSYNWTVNVQDQAGTATYPAAFTITGLLVGPTVTPFAPQSPVYSLNPTVQWTITLGAGTQATNYQVRTFTPTQMGIGGFNPGTSPATDDSTLLAGANESYTLNTALTVSDSYTSYVQVTATNDLLSGWVPITYQIGSFVVPPEHTQYYTTANVAYNGNVMEITAVSNGNVTISTALGGTDATLNGVPVNANLNAVISGYFRALLLATPQLRSCYAQIDWYTATGTFISSTVGSTVVDTDNSWTRVFAAGAPSAEAVYFNRTFVIENCVAGEVHYFDAAQAEITVATTPTVWDPPRDIKINLLAKRRNLIANPTFNQNTNGWTVL